MQNLALIEKIQNLPPEIVSEVEDFVDFLTEKKAKRSGSKESFAIENSDLQKRGISKTEAAEQRAALASFAEDWELPEMEIYDKL